MDRNTAATYIDCNNASEEGHEGALLQLVAEDGRVGAPGGTHRQARRRVPHGNGDARLGSAFTIQQNICSKSAMSTEFIQRNSFLFLQVLPEAKIAVNSKNNIV
jgi:hypothetical protein